ncbi:MAG TPA: hypothetical protein VLI46_01960 [Ramlibacter sp.]|nr:hypothetical protein [Ramlibacter sp.]
MTPHRQQLLDMILEPDRAFDQPLSDIAPLQLRAAQELFEARRQQIPLVNRRAEEAGIDRIEKLDDIVPLLFAHTVYKSYPPSFVEQGRWDRMLQWLDTLSVDDVSKVNIEGVKDVDDWIARLWEAGHMVLATSGSSGKCSFLNHTRGDSAMKQRHFRHAVGWPFVKASPDRPVFWLGPVNGPNSACEAARMNAANWGRPGAIYALTNEPLRIAEVSRMAAMRKKMAEGTAGPQEIADFEQEARQKAIDGRAAMLKLADTILDHRHEPMMLSGMWAQYMMLIARARERGIGDGEFHPDSIVNAGGGVKGIALPDDYQQQVARFVGKVIRPAAYGMTELAQVMPRCEAGRYHRSPGLIWLILDRDGERLLTADDGEDGVVEGRFAFLDLLYEGRWGGLITGDKVKVDFKPRCACGRTGPSLFDNITRFAQVGEDDHIGCAGTIDGYIRGEIGA